MSKNVSEKSTPLKLRSRNIEIDADIERFNCTEEVKTRFRKCWSWKTLKKKLPIVVWLPKYSWRSLQSDAIAGITVGLTVIPQGLAYAGIAGLHPQFGLYAAFMGCFVYCFLGTSKDITIGPTAIMSLMTVSFATSPIKYDPTYAIVLTLMLGIVQLVMGLLNLGILVNFISLPVISAFTSSAAIFITIGQLKGIFGLHNIPHEILRCIYWTFAKLGEVNKWDCSLGISSMVVIFFMKKLRSIDWRDVDMDITRAQKIARKCLWFVGTATNAIVVVAASALVAVFDSQNIHHTITTCPDINSNLPPFAPPAFSLKVNGTEIGGGEILQSIGVGLIVVPILGLIELIAIGNTFARKNNYKIDATQELIALGVANILSSFVSSYPITGSFSRTAINSQSGSCTPASGLFTGALALLALAVLSPLFAYIPLATLSAMIIVAVLPITDLRILRRLWKRQKPDLFPWAVTVLTSFVLGIEYGIICGTGASLLFILYRAARPKIKISGRHIHLISLNTGLQYPAADYVSKKVMEVSDKDDICIIIDCQHIHTVDFTTIQMFVNIHLDLHKKRVPFVLLALKPHIAEQLVRTGMDFKTAGTVDEAHCVCEDAFIQDSLKNNIPPGSILKIGDFTSHIPRQTTYDSSAVI